MRKKKFITVEDVFSTCSAAQRKQRFEQLMLVVIKNGEENLSGEKPEAGSREI